METLSQQVRGLADILERIESSDGMIDVESEFDLDIKSINLKSKIDSMQFVLDNLTLQEEYHNNNADKFKKQAASISKAIDRLKDYIKFVMKQNNTAMLEGDMYKFLLVGMMPRLVLEQSLIPDEYYSTVVTKELNKDKIKEDLENGIKVNGARLTPVEGLRRLINRKATK